MITPSRVARVPSPKKATPSGRSTRSRARALTPVEKRALKMGWNGKGRVKYPGVLLFGSGACPECMVNLRGGYDHSIWCSQITRSAAIKEARAYHKAWWELEEQRRNKQEDGRQHDLKRVKKAEVQAQLWRGKYLEVCQENNALRKKLTPALGIEAKSPQAKPRTRSVKPGASRATPKTRKP